MLRGKNPLEKMVKLHIGLEMRKAALKILDEADKLCGSKTSIIPKGFVCTKEHKDGSKEVIRG